MPTSDRPSRSDDTVCDRALADHRDVVLLGDAGGPARAGHELVRRRGLHRAARDVGPHAAARSSGIAVAATKTVCVSSTGTTQLKNANSVRSPGIR